MTSESGKGKFELFSSLSTRLQDCLHSNKIEQALKVAQERHSVLISVLENTSLMGLERSEYASKAKACIDIEQSLAKSTTLENRSNFLCRRNAYRAYGMRSS